MGTLDTAYQTYSNNPIQSGVPGEDLIMFPVNLMPSHTYAKGSFLGPKTATGGTYGPCIYITNVALTSNVATITTSGPHGLAVGDTIRVAAVTATTVNGTTETVASVPSTTTFTYAKTASNVASAADTGTVTLAAGCELATAVLPYACSTDSTGAITIGTTADPAGFTYKLTEAIFGGFVRTEDLSGPVALTVTHLGKLVKGTTTNGILNIR